MATRTWMGVIAAVSAAMLAYAFPAAADPAAGTVLNAETWQQAEGMLPPLAVGQVLPLKEMLATERFSRPLPRFTEASLVKKLEELGITQDDVGDAIAWARQRA